MLVEVSKYKLVEHRFWFIFKHIKIASKRNKICLKLGGQILPQTSGADTVASAMMTVPVFVSHDLVDVVLVICSQAECAELSFAFVVDTALVATFFARLWVNLTRRNLRCLWIQVLIKVREEHFGVTSKLLLTKGTQIVRIDIKFLHPCHQLLIVLLEADNVNSKLCCSGFFICHLLLHK